jgi:UDP-N-acetylmuramoylalanine--D-glutamate ligase
MAQDLKGKNITVMGLGLHGGAEGLIKFLIKSGAKVKVTDLKNERDLAPTLNRLKGLPIEYHLGGHAWSDFSGSDLVFVNPAIPKDSLYLKKMRKEGIETSSEMNLFFKLCPAPIVGVTGTNGKSTTVTLIWKILKRLKGRKVHLGGNIGGSLLENLNKISEDDIVILEFSSFQLEDLGREKRSPHISVVLNVTPDHLDRHKDFNEYLNIKKNIVRFQSESDFAILNYSDKNVRKFSEVTHARAIYFGLEPKKGAIYLDDGKIISDFRGENQPILTRKKIHIPGNHNLENILAAIAVGLIFKVKKESIVRAISEFRGLEHRIEYITEKNGIKYYNDSKATTPESVMAALDSFSESIILIAGGKDKGMDFGNLASEILKKVRILILLGEARKKIKESVVKKMNKAKGKIKLQEIIEVASLREAVIKAKKVAKAGEIILLSPACASFDMFNSFEDRGEQFKSLVLNK